MASPLGTPSLSGCSVIVIISRCYARRVTKRKRRGKTLKVKILLPSPSGRVKLKGEFSAEEEPAMLEFVSSTLLHLTFQNQQEFWGDEDEDEETGTLQ